MTVAYWVEPIDLILQSGVSANGNGEIFDLESRYGSLTMQITGVTTATINFEASNDNGSTWKAIRGIDKNTGNGATSISDANANSIFCFAVSGIKLFRARISDYSAGKIYIYATATPLSEPANQATTTTGTVAIDQSTPGTTNAVQLTGRKLAVVRSTYNQALNVAPGGNATITITPNTGELWRIKHIYIQVNAVGSSNYHSINIYEAGTGAGDKIISAQSPAANQIEITRNVVTIGTATPSDVNVQNRAILNMVAANTAPLTIYYSNDTDATQTATLYITICREVEYIVS